jgi:hypothetical protein
LSIVAHDIFFATGNTFGAGTWSDGEAVFRLGPDLQRTDGKRDYFAPMDWKVLDAHDEDLGGSNPLPLNIPSPSSDQAVILALGKDRKAYLLDRSDLGGIGGQLTAATVSDMRIITSPASYPVGNDIFVAFQAPGTHCPAPSNNNGLTVLKITGGSPRQWALPGVVVSAAVVPLSRPQRMDIPIRLYGSSALKATIAFTRSAAILANQS